MSNQKQLTVKELIERGRTLLLSTQANANTTSINSYDTIANQLVQFVELSNKQSVEILRLQELCRKNNIQFTLPPPEPVKLSENVAVIPEPKPSLETPETTNL